MASTTDAILGVLPVRYCHNFDDLQLHQYPLLTRPLQIPPTAAQSGKFIRSRVKPNSRRIEVLLPIDTRQEVWNKEKGKQFGAARAEDDKAKNREATQSKPKEGEEPRLSDIRLSSEEIEPCGTYMLGTVRDGQLHLHPISQIHQFRPTLAYLDALSSKNKRRAAGDDSDMEDGPPSDIESAIPSAGPSTKEKKPTGEAKEVQVSARKAEDKGGTQNFQGGMSNARREILTLMRNEEAEEWEDLQYCDIEANESAEMFEGLFSKTDEQLECTTNVTQFLKEIDGL